MIKDIVLLSGLAASVLANPPLATDINQISQYWGQLTPYSDNPQNFFGVQNVGLPVGCQIEQVQSLQRHAQRFPTGSDIEGGNAERFAQKVANYTAHIDAAPFTGPLTFLKSYRYVLGESYLTGIGATTEFAAGSTFWNRYGRILYNATKGQVAYNATAANGTPRRKPVLRTTGQSRIWNSQINWALGFFGTSFQFTPDPSLAGAQSAYDAVIIPEGGTENNTLASYDSCFNDNTDSIGAIGDREAFAFIPKYLGPATQRLQQYAGNLKLTVNDTYAMQDICAAESAYLGLGRSSFCDLFTLDEWKGFDRTLSIYYYYNYAFGNPTGRAQGIGYLQELLARLKNQYIPVSNSSVNSTLDNNGQSFPLGEPFYADFTHDDIIVSTLTAMSFDYFRDAPSCADATTPSRFDLARITPFGGRLITELVGCDTPNPVAVPDRVQYYPTQYGYNAAAAKYKFIRLRLNNGVLPIQTIRGGQCAGRSDGMCPLDKFLASQAKAYELSNYNYACFANYTIPGDGKDYDGTIFAPH